MSKCAVYGMKRQMVAEVEFHSTLPNAAAEVYSRPGQRIGSIEASYAGGQGKIYNAQGDVVGTVLTDAVVDDGPCLAINDDQATIGGVVNTRQVMRGTGPGQWTKVGTVATKSWTKADNQAFGEAAIETGTDAPGPECLRDIQTVQAKQRALAGVAALLLSRLGNEMEAKASLRQPRTYSYTYKPERRAKEPSASTYNLWLAFLLCLPWWAIIILTDNEDHHTLVKVVAWVILAITFAILAILFVALLQPGNWGR